MNNSRLVLMLSIVALTGCGGGVDEGFTGQWTGNTTVTGSTGAFTYAATINLVADGDTLRVSQICPDGTGRIQVPGEGSTLKWSGEFNCPVALASCPSARVAYTSASISLGKGAVVVSGSGTLSGCGSFVPITSIFTGTK